MLQFIAQQNDNFSIPEQVQMAIEGGCKWVQLRVNGLSDSEIKDIAAEVIPLCKESETLLTIEDHLELAKELAIHGVILVDASVSVEQAREFCGPEAIIGVMVHTPSQIIDLRNVDVDYVAFPPDTPLTDLFNFVCAVRDADVMIPIVAFADDYADDLAKVLDTGVSGIALGRSISDSADPVAATETIIKALNCN